MTYKDQIEYMNAMKSCKQFFFFGLQPEWVPNTGDIDGFIRDEVIRQFHDPRVETDGAVRVRGMKSAWWYAQDRAEFPIREFDILRIAAHIEPEKNMNGYRLHDVYIGDNTGAPPGLIPPMVGTLLQNLPDVPAEAGRKGPHANEYRSTWRFGITDRTLPVFMELADGIQTADDWYLAFEAVHPFGDGNGRTGKTLYNWLRHTLDEPELMPDYFNGGNP